MCGDWDSVWLTGERLQIRGGLYQTSTTIRLLDGLIYEVASQFFSASFSITCKYLKQGASINYP